MVYADPERRVEPAWVKALCDVIAHRGPDEDGAWVAGEAGLGIQRLKIIDLSTGRQPIHNEDRTVWIVFNGEIYNYRELRDRLAARGHRFYTKSDTETIVHLYEDHGDDCVTFLNGMFAFALWDTRSRKLLLARDRVGEKQLYYTLDGDGITFGSEIKVLLRDPARARRIDPVALRDYFTYHYVPGERTMFDGIRRLPPGHVLAYEGGKAVLSRYWELSPAPRAVVDEVAAAEEFRERFCRAVRMRLVSDVPLGAFLSGGIDSSAVVAAMAGVGSGPVRTFTIGYEGEGRAYDERRWARLVAERFGTDHHEFVVRPDIAAIVPEVVRAFDEPFADASAIPTWYISKLTRQHVTVALSGVGGDELGGGYERYLGVLLAERYRHVPRALRGLVASVVRRLPDSRNGTLGVDRAKRFVDGVDCGLQERYRRYVSTFSRQELGGLLGPLGPADGASDDDALARAFASADGLDPVTVMMAADVATYLPDDLLVLGDRLSMAHSLEVRAPFLDHELMEFAASLPARLKVRGWTKKYLMRRAFAPMLPRAVLHRSKKGFSIPLAVWFRSTLRGFLTDWLYPTRVRRLGCLDDRMVARLIDEHLTYRQNHEQKLWALLVFAVWHAEYMERR
jgi:asparagine synthase (glutamine-hydrolysing)